MTINCKVLGDIRANAQGQASLRVQLDNAGTEREMVKALVLTRDGTDVARCEHSSGLAPGDEAEGVLASGSSLNKRIERLEIAVDALRRKKEDARLPLLLPCEIEPGETKLGTVVADIGTPPEGAAEYEGDWSVRAETT